MAVLAYRGDIRHLSCDAWYLPGDFRPYIARYWFDGDPELQEAAARLGPFPDDWGPDGMRVLPLQLTDRRRATPVLAAIPLDGTDEWSYHRETLRQFAALARTLPRPAHLDERPRRLLAVPLIGTGLSAWKPNSAAHVAGLLDALHEESAAGDVDFALVLRSEVTWSATQALRRRRLIDSGADPELTDLVVQAEALATQARSGRLVLFTGAGISQPAGLPDWRGLLAQLADEAHFEANAVGRLTEMPLLDQAALIARRTGEARLADRVAEVMTAPHHALAHGLLANLPVRETVTLNYDELFEMAAQDAYAPVSVLPYEPAQQRWLIKLHGCIRPDRRHDIVLTRNDYLSLGEHRATLTGLVQALLVTRTCCSSGSAWATTTCTPSSTTYGVRWGTGDEASSARPWSSTVTRCSRSYGRTPRLRGDGACDAGSRPPVGGLSGPRAAAVHDQRPTPVRSRVRWAAHRGRNPAA